MSQDSSHKLASTDNCEFSVYKQTIEVQGDYNDHRLIGSIHGSGHTNECHLKQSSTIRLRGGNVYVDCVTPDSYIEMHV